LGLSDDRSSILSDRSKTWESIRNSQNNYAADFDGGMNLEGKEVDFYPPAMALVVKGQSKIHSRIESPTENRPAQAQDGTANTIFDASSGNSIGAANQPKDQTSNFYMGDGGTRYLQNPSPSLAFSPDGRSLASSGTNNGNNAGNN